MELILIDSGLLTKAGHSYKLTKTVSQAPMRRKSRYRIFGLRGLVQVTTAAFNLYPEITR